MRFESKYSNYADHKERLNYNLKKNDRWDRVDNLKSFGNSVQIRNCIYSTWQKLIQTNRSFWRMPSCNPSIQPLLLICKKSLFPLTTNVTVGRQLANFLPQRILFGVNFKCPTSSFWEGKMVSSPIFYFRNLALFYLPTQPHTSVNFATNNSTYVLFPLL